MAQTNNPQNPNEDGDRNGDQNPNNPQPEAQ